jgi:hypothetical protein
MMDDLANSGNFILCSRNLRKIPKTSESLLFYLSETGLLLKITPETIRRKKKVCLVFLPLFT